MAPFRHHWSWYFRFHVRLNPSGVSSLDTDSLLPRLLPSIGAVFEGFGVWTIDRGVFEVVMVF